MARRESESARKLKKEWSAERARATRQVKRERLAAVLEKGKLETLGDCHDLVNGLSKRTVYKMAMCHAISLYAAGCSPREIVELLEHEQLNKLIEDYQ